LVPSTKPRIQVTLDDELASALDELGSGKSRSRAVRDLALRGAEVMRAESTARSEAREHLRRIATGEDDRYDFGVSERLHAER
jgi:metal-responsive CopG/Arc/MetJ family transcriptional regulator